ncbi:hypothetical protein EVAR_71111_1 [Eumeta japonica]|uniref:Uncharacterized protein n=1 Tax=Eumeta variegata TaxID=151549 RepID=A0A4C2AG89_EUMVA|nr:hypothetical protein EVAR_71111_1 [Eumeta japonica]
MAARGTASPLIKQTRRERIKPSATDVVVTSVKTVIRCPQLGRNKCEGRKTKIWDLKSGKKDHRRVAKPQP